MTLEGDGDLAAQAFRACMDEIVRIEGRYSRFLSTSYLTEVNRVAAEGGSIEVDEEAANLLTYAYACFEKSDGLFDITSGLLRRVWNFHGQTLPSSEAIQAALSKIGFEKLVWNRPFLHFPVSGMELDFGGIGKEYAVDRCVEIGRSLGIVSGLVELAGDIGGWGPRLDGSDWRIAICDPKDRERCFSTLPLRSKARLSKGSECRPVEICGGGLATSGDYARGMTVDGRRYGHLLNPKTGWPVEGLASVTVIAPTCLTAGTISSIGMLKGMEGPKWLAASGFSHGWISHEGAFGGDLFEDLRA